MKARLKRLARGSVTPGKVRNKKLEIIFWEKAIFMRALRMLARMAGSMEAELGGG
ncbi:MAG: hypothetical protein QXI18_00195 [Nitrososphaerota archaeon]